MEYAPEELLMTVIARMLKGLRHVAVGVASPVPGGAALLARAQSGDRMKVTIIGHPSEPFRREGGVELFDCAAQGRIDGFFLSGGQIDGQANINLTGIGEYPRQNVRWSGAFGSAFMYFTVPKVILFRDEHTKRVLVPKVDFVTAPGVSPANVYRPGGPHALVTDRCLFGFDRERGRFRLESVHPGHSVEEVRENTGFDFDIPAETPETPVPDAAVLDLIRGPVARLVAEPYPRFAERVFGIGQAAA